MGLAAVALASGPEAFVEALLNRLTLQHAVDFMMIDVLDRVHEDASIEPRVGNEAIERLL